MTFRPKKAQNAIEMYKSHLLNGEVLKIDGGGHEQVDIIPRSDVDEWKAQENVGSGNYPTLPRYVDQFQAAISELKDEGYVVVKRRCEYSGCCQYSAYRYFLAGEE